MAFAYVVRICLRHCLRCAYATAMAAYAGSSCKKGLTQHVRQQVLAPDHSSSLRAIYFTSKGKEAVRQLHYTAEDVEDEDKVDEISCKCWNSNLHTTWSSCVTLIAAALICWLRKTSDTESRS